MTHTATVVEFDDLSFFHTYLVELLNLGLNNSLGNTVLAYFSFYAVYFFPDVLVPFFYFPFNFWFNYANFLIVIYLSISIIFLYW